MLTLQAIRNDTSEVIERLSKRGKDRTEDIREIIRLDELKRSKQAELEQNLAKGNILAREIGDLFKSGNQAEANLKKEESLALKELNKSLEAEMSSLDDQLTQKLYEIPNTPSASLKTGQSADDNEVVFEWG